MEVGLQPPSPNRKLNKTNFVDKDFKRYTFPRNQLHPADDRYTGILKNKLKT
jgi:hypothetical protein